MDLEFPIEFIVEGTPVSFQAARAEAKAQWKERVKKCSSSALPEDHWASKDRIAVTLYYFPPETMQGDIPDAEGGGAIATLGNHAECIDTWRATDKRYQSGRTHVHDCIENNGGTAARWVSFGRGASLIREPNWRNRGTP